MPSYDLRQLAVMHGKRSLSALAREAGVSRSTTDAMQRGGAVSPVSINAIATALGISSNDVIGAIDTAAKRRRKAMLARCGQ